MKTNKIYFGIGILIILLFTILISYSNNNLIQLYPENNSILTDNQPTFKWVGKADKLIIDDNDEFTSPVIENVEDNSYRINNKLNFIKYYWKLSGNKNSSVWQFRIDSVVALELKNQSNLYNITNVGTTDLDVEVIEEERSLRKITGSFILRLNETQQFNLKNKTIFIGKQR